MTRLKDRHRRHRLQVHRRHYLRRLGNIQLLNIEQSIGNSRTEFRIFLVVYISIYVVVGFIRGVFVS